MQGIHKAHTTFRLKKHKLLLLPFSLFTLTLLSAYFLSHIPTTSRATSIVDRVSVSIDSITCTMEGNIASGNEHTTTISNGTSKEGIGVTELRTVCNDANGYSIYAIGYSGTLGDPYNNAKLAGRTDMVGITTGNKIATGTYDSTLPISDSLWSMKIIADVDENSQLPANLTIENNFDEYHAVPSFYTKVASYSTKTGESPNGVSTIKTTYAASVSDVETPDTYIGQVKYTMVHPDSGLDTSITFNDAFQLSGKTPVEDTILYKMQDMNAVICNRVTNGQTSELIDIRDNKVYTVAKINGDCWMTTTPTNVNYSCPAQWMDPESTTNGYCIADNTMQGFTQDDAATMALHETIQLRDIRDNNIYPVARLADGNIWLLDNLRLGSTSSISLSSRDTNLIAGRTWTLPAYNSSNDTTSVNGGNIYTAASINTANANESLSSDNYVDGYSGTIGKRGAYYNYCAVSAGTACENQNADIAITVLEEDICPKGWRVPSANVMYDLPGYYESSTDTLNILRIAFTGLGRYNGSAIDTRFGEMGSFWESNIAAGAQNAYRLYITRDGDGAITAINWTGTSGRGNRYPVRCLLRTE